MGNEEARKVKEAEKVKSKQFVICIRSILDLQCLFNRVPNPYVYFCLVNN